MTGQITVRSTRPRRQPLQPAIDKKSKSNVREVAGNTTADICVLCCCCPCVLFKFVIVAVYKVPATVIRRLWKKHRRKLPVVVEMSNGGVQVHLHRRHQVVVGYADELSDVDLKEFEMEKVKVSIDGSAEAVELDKQMWDRFRDAGFWRSPSQRFEFT